MTKTNNIKKFVKLLSQKLQSKGGGGGVPAAISTGANKKRGGGENSGHNTKNSPIYFCLA